MVPEVLLAMETAMTKHVHLLAAYCLTVSVCDCLFGYCL
jgi:hypothetical protein